MTIGVIGSGSIAQRHIRNIRDLRGENYDDIVLFRHKASSSKKRLRDIEAYPKKGNFRYRVDQVVKGDEKEFWGYWPEAVIVCGPTAFHPHWAMKALKHDAHVFVEKPLWHRFDARRGDDVDIEDLLGEVEEGNRIFRVGYQYQFDQCLSQFQYVIAKKLEEHSNAKISGVNVVWREHLPNAHPWENYKKGYAVRSELGGGVLPCYSHDLDILLTLFGQPMYVVKALTTSLHTKREITYDVDETIDVTLENLRCKKITLKQSFYSPAVKEHYIKVCFDDDTYIIWDIEGGTVGTPLNVMTDVEAGVILAHLPNYQNPTRNDAYKNEMSSFLRAIERQEEFGDTIELDRAIVVCELMENIQKKIKENSAHDRYASTDWHNTS